MESGFWKASHWLQYDIELSRWLSWNITSSLPCQISRQKEMSQKHHFCDQSLRHILPRFEALREICFHGQLEGDNDINDVCATRWWFFELYLFGMDESIWTNRHRLGISWMNIIHRINSLYITFQLVQNFFNQMYKCPLLLLTCPKDTAIYLVAAAFLHNNNLL